MTNRGEQFISGVYRDPWRMVLSRGTGDTAFTHTPFETVEDMDARIDAQKSGTLNGLIPMGSADGVIFMFFGGDADNNTMNYQVNAISPVVNAAREIIAYQWQIMAGGVVTLHSITAGAAGAAAGLAADDLVADTVTIADISYAPSGLGNVRTVSAALRSCWLPVAALGAEYMLIQVERGTAADYLVMARRVASLDALAYRGG